MVPPEPERLLELDTRRRIYEALQRSPGLHMRAIQREIGIALGTVEYHLYQLEREGLVATRHDGRFKCYFPKDATDRRDRDVLYYLRQAMPRRIAMEVAAQPGIHFQELAMLLPISRSTLSFHLKKLLAAGIVTEAADGRQKTYACPETERIRRLVVTYRATFVDDVVDRFAAAWLDVDALPKPDERS